MLTNTIEEEAVVISHLAAATIPVAAELAVISEPSTISTLPADLNTTNNIVDIVISSLEGLESEEESLNNSSFRTQQEVYMDT